MKKYTIVLIMLGILAIGAVAAVAASTPQSGIDLRENATSQSEWDGVIVTGNSAALEQSIEWREGDPITVQITNTRTGQSSTMTMYPDSPV